MPDYIDKHCIKLDGSIPYGSPLKKFVYSKEALFCGALIGYSVLRGELESDPYFALSVYTTLIGGVVGGRAYHNWRLGLKLKEYFGSAHGGLFINKKPNENSLPTKPSHALASYTIRNDQMSRAISYTISVVIGLSIGMLLRNDIEPQTSSNTSDDQSMLIALGISTVLAAIGTYYSKYYSTAWRFNKVVKGDWVITDEPPRKTQDVTMKDLAERYLPKPIFQPVHN